MGKCGFHPPLRLVISAAVETGNHDGCAGIEEVIYVGAKTGPLCGQWGKEVLCHLVKIVKTAGVRKAGSLPPFKLRGQDRLEVRGILLCVSQVNALDDLKVGFHVSVPYGSLFPMTQELFCERIFAMTSASNI